MCVCVCVWVCEFAHINAYLGFALLKLHLQIVEGQTSFLFRGTGAGHRLHLRRLWTLAGSSLNLLHPLPLFLCGCCGRSRRELKVADCAPASLRTQWSRGLGWQRALAGGSRLGQGRRSKAGDRFVSRGNKRWLVLRRRSRLLPALLQHTQTARVHSRLHAFKRLRDRDCILVLWAPGHDTRTTTGDDKTWFKRGSYEYITVGVHWKYYRHMTKMVKRLWRLNENRHSRRQEMMMEIVHIPVTL